MKEVINIMLSAYEEYKEAGSYLLFYLLALGMGLSIAHDRSHRAETEDNWKVEEAKKKIRLWPFLYALLALVLVVMNPAAVFVFHKMVPLRGQYYKIWPLLLFLFLCAYGFVCFLSILREQKQKILSMAGVVVLIGLAGNGYGLLSQRGGEEIFKEEAAIMEIVKNVREDAMLLAADPIVEYAGMYEPKVRLVYGKDLYMPNLDLGIADTYAPEVLELYEAMQSPGGCMGEIAHTAVLYDCDVIVVKKFEKAPDKAGVYYKEKETSQYLVYVR